MYGMVMWGGGGCTRGPGIVSSAADLLGMRRVYEMCMGLARGSVTS